MRPMLPAHSRHPFFNRGKSKRPQTVAGTARQEPPRLHIPMRRVCLALPVRGANKFTPRHGRGGPGLTLPRSALLLRHFRHIKDLARIDQIRIADTLPVCLEDFDI